MGDWAAARRRRLDSDGPADGAGLQVRSATLASTAHLQESEHPARVARCVPDQLPRRGLLEGIRAGEAESASSSARVAIVASWPLRAAETEHAQPREQRRGDRAGDGRLGRAPTRTMVPASTWGRSASCWPCCSDGLVEEDDRGAALQGAALRAASTTPRSVATPSVVEFMASNRAPTASASRRPMVVLPDPAAPQDAGGQAAALDQASKRRPRPQEGGLAHHLVQRPGRIRSASGGVKGRREEGDGAVPPRGGPRRWSRTWRPAGLRVRRPGGSGDLRDEEGRNRIAKMPMKTTAIRAGHA